MQVTIILVAPTRAENVGAAARAMKTMGFSSLRIVDSDAHLQPAAQWVAHGAGEILQQAVSYDSLAMALTDIDFKVASTARMRGKYRYYCSPQQLESLLQERQQWCTHIGLIFGREASGLTNDELALADLLTSIPMRATYPSLNLGQAVMLYCYQLSILQQSILQQQAASPQQATLQQQELLRQQAISAVQQKESLAVLRQRFERLLNSVASSDDRTLMEWIHQRLGYLQKRDIALLHTLLQNIDNKLSK